MKNIKTKPGGADELLLSEYKYLQEIKSKADRKLKDLKELIQKNLKPGIYGDHCLTFETREVRSYVVPERIDHIIKVTRL